MNSENERDSSGISSEWSAVVRSDSRRLAEQRAERDRLREEYKRKLIEKKRKEALPRTPIAADAPQENDTVSASASPTAESVFEPIRRERTDASPTPAAENERSLHNSPTSLAESAENARDVSTSCEETVSNDDAAPTFAPITRERTSDDILHPEEEPHESSVPDSEASGEPFVPISRRAPRAPSTDNNAIRTATESNTTPTGISQREGERITVSIGGAAAQGGFADNNATRTATESNTAPTGISQREGDRITVSIGGAATVREAEDDGFIRIPARSYTVEHTAQGVSAAGGANSLYNEYNRVCEIMANNERYYLARIAELEREHKRLLSLATDQRAVDAENRRYDAAVTEAAVAHGENMGELINRRRELSDSISEGQTGAPYTPVSPYPTEPYAPGAYAEPVSDLYDPIEEISYSPSEDDRAIPYYDESYSEPPTDVGEAIDEMNYSASSDDREISYPEEAAYAEAQTDLTEAQTEVDYGSAIRERQVAYPTEEDMYSDSDESAGAAPYSPEPLGDGEGFDYRYDDTVDVGGFEDEALSEYGADNESHITYDEEQYVPLPVATTDYDRRMIEDEHIRFLRDTERRERMRRENPAPTTDPTETATRAISPEEKLSSALPKAQRAVELRMLTEADGAEREIAYELLHFSNYDSKATRERRRRARRAAKMRRSVRRAKKLERRSTERYYRAAYAPETAAVKVKDREELDSILRRLDFILAERESIDERLATLYVGSEREGDDKIIRRANKKRMRTAKRVHRSLRSLDKRLEKLHAPLDLKEKIRDLFNKKMDAAAKIEYSKYLLHKQKPKGEARRELKNTISESRRVLRYVDKDIRHFMKKAQKHDDEHKSNIVWAVWLIVTLVVAVLGILVWYFFGDAIVEFFKGLSVNVEIGG